MMGLKITSKNDIPDKQLKRWVKEAITSGCETIEEMNGYLMSRYQIRVRNSKNVEFAPAIKKMIPWIVETLDKKYEEGKRGKELSFIVRSTDFLIEMGEGTRKFYELGYNYVAGAIRNSLLLHGINIQSFKRGRKGYYLFYALTDEDAEIIEERIRKNQRKAGCKKIAKEVCHHGIHNEDANSIWKDVEFIKNIGRCKFDVEMIENDIQRKKDLLLFGNAKDGIALLFG